MKKAIFTLAILLMAFGNAGFAQRNANLKWNVTPIVLKHFGLRDASTVRPQTAVWMNLENEKYRTTYTWEDEYTLTEEYTELDEGDGWRDYSMTTHEYDFSGLPFEDLIMVNDGFGWENELKRSYTNGANGINEVVVQVWDNGNWVNDEKYVFDYNGFVITILIWDWNGTNWSSDELYTYTYGDQNVELVIQYMQGGAWQNDERQVTTFDFNGKITEILDQDWVGTSWVNDMLTNYVFEGDVFPVKTVQNWNGSAWVDNIKFVYEHDAYGNAKHGECYELNGTWMAEDGDIEIKYGDGNSQMEFYGYMVDVEYVDLMAVSEGNAANFSVYPVPAQGEITIETEGFAKAELYNLMGQMLMESQQPKMNIEALPAGSYLLKVFRNDGVSMAKSLLVK